MEGRCTRCEGRGQTRWARGHMVFSKACATCGGTGGGALTCARPASARGARCAPKRSRCACRPACRTARGCGSPRQGHAGRHGGTAGDLYVTIQVAPHPLFRRDGDDLRCTIPIAVHEAVLGARVEVPALDGMAGSTCRPARRAAVGSGRAAAAFPTAGGGAGDSWSKCASCCLTRIDERSQELIREFGRRNPGGRPEDISR